MTELCFNVLQNSSDSVSALDPVDLPDRSYQTGGQQTLIVKSRKPHGVRSFRYRFVTLGSSVRLFSRSVYSGAMNSFAYINI